jgi:hypothetical protein
MRRALMSILVFVSLMTAMPVNAQAEIDGDELIRLPGQGLVKPDTPAAQRKIERLVPGGGLISSFDVNNDGLISAGELASGISAAFEAADANGDGQLVALEQIEWANNLPTRDDTLANPVRFDPNLDRVVTFDEFQAVISGLAETYQDRSGSIAISALSAPEPKPERDGLLSPFGGPGNRPGGR